jgi:hypothetical protein
LDDALIFGVLIGRGGLGGNGGDCVRLKDTFKEPTILGLTGATALAVFQFLNSFGMMDDIAYRLHLLETASGPNEKFLIIPKSFEVWGVLELSIQDYIIVGFLIYTLIGLRVHRPREQGVYKPKKKKKQLISVKSRGWLRAGLISLLIGLLSTVNKTGRIAALANNIDGENREGRLRIVDGGPGFELLEWAPQDYAELTIIYFLFLLGLRKGIKIDTSQLTIIDSGTHIEKIWVNSDQADRLQRTNVEEGASRINRAFTDLVNMLGAAVSLNLAAAALEDGNVKNAFNKWKNLTHKKGKQAKDWKGLSESIDDVGKFKQRDEEE